MDITTDMDWADLPFARYSFNVTDHDVIITGPAGAPYILKPGDWALKHDPEYVPMQYRPLPMGWCESCHDEH